jgi:hypothetical protein
VGGKNNPKSQQQKKAGAKSAGFLFFLTFAKKLFKIRRIKKQFFGNHLSEKESYMIMTTAGEKQTKVEKITAIILAADQKNKPVSLLIREKWGSICLIMQEIVFWDKEKIEGRIEKKRFSQKTFYKKIPLKKIEHAKIVDF